MSGGVIQVALHGVRGSAPASGAPFARFGGDTPSVEARHAGERVFIDAGSGLRNVRCDEDFPGETDLILTHYHYDHLIGLPFFEPVWRVRGRLRIWAPILGDIDPNAVIEKFFAPPYCPVSLSMMAMQVEIRPYRPGVSWRLSERLGVSTTPVNHPGGCAAVRLHAPASDVVYASDVEIRPGREADRLAHFASGAGLFIVDAMNDDHERKSRVGWGHSNWRDALDVAAAAGAGRTALFHHDPRRTDQELERLDLAANARNPLANFAIQGWIWEAPASDMDVSPQRMRR